MKNGVFSYKLAVAAERSIKEEEYWLNKLTGDLIKCNFPYDYRTEIISQRLMKVETFQFPETLASGLMKLSQGSSVDVKLHMLLVTGLFILLNKYTGNSDIMIGSPLVKQEIESEFINNLLVFRNEVHHHMSFKNLLLQVRETIIQAIKHQNYPMELLIEQFDLPIKNNEFPLFDVVVSLENLYDKRFIQDIHYNMGISFLRTGESIAGEVEYNSILYRASTIKQIIRHYMHVLEQALQDANGRLSHIRLLSKEERQQVLFDFNHASAHYPKDKTLQQLFAEQVNSFPDHIAVIGQSIGAIHESSLHLLPIQITYNELNQKSNPLAQLLRVKGVQPDTTTALMLKPSIELIIGILAILKAGGAYLSIDPKTPTNRVNSMLAESRVSILLTDSQILDNHSFTALQDLTLTRQEPKVTASRERITNMDILPLTNRWVIDYNKYNQYIGYAGVKHTISLETTRGCPYNCTYCHKIFPGKQVSRSAENILSEVLYYYKLGVRRFSIIDDIFNLNIKNSSRFFKLIIKNSLQVQLFFSAGLRGDILTEEYIDLMVRAGTVSMSPALETASPRLQKLIGKNLNIKRFRRNIEYICKKHPQVISELFIMHGFPTETQEEVRQTMDFVKSLKWIHFPYINILRIYSSTKMAKLAVQNGISYEAITRSEDLAWHELPETLPFAKSFTLKIQTEFMDEYLLNKERLLHVLPYQMRVMTEDELVQKYNSYLPMDIDGFSQLLQFAGIKKEELGDARFLPVDRMCVPDLNEKLRKASPIEVPGPQALKVLLLDLNLYFTQENNMLYDLVGEPLGLMRLMTQLQQHFGSRINGKIAKSRIDFNNYGELKALLKEFKPDVIGIRTLTFYRDFFHMTTALMRQWGINAPIIVGGPHVTTNYQAVLQDSNIDLAVLGEGDITIVELIGKILENQGELPGEEILAGIPGLAFIPRKENTYPEFAREIILPDAVHGRLSQDPEENLKYINQPTDLAYVIFTSGSTGKPKGVMVEHGNVIANLFAFYREFEIKPENIVIQLASSSFDVFVEEVFPILLKGGKIVIPGESEIMDMDLLSRLIVRHHVDIIDCTPLLLNELNKLSSASPVDNPLKRVHTFISGGDVLKKEHVNNLLTSGTVYNTYGPTEITVCAAYYRLPPGDNKSSMPLNIPIGKPISNYSIYILDDNHTLVPIGVTGELSISGPGVTRGYLNRPELTAEKFIELEFEEEEAVEIPGKRIYSHTSYMSHMSYIYKTGDLGRWLPDGNIEFLGRNDQQIKIRGFRIELGEIENQLLGYEEIKEAVVIAAERTNQNADRDDAASKYLCAYLVSKDDIDISALKETLSGRLPDYMIPTYFMQLNEIPLTPNGKVDKKALPNPELISEKDYIPPGNELEEKLVEIWSEVLGIEKEIIGINNNYFDLGGNSIKIIQLNHQLKKIFNRDIPVVTMFRYTTIRSLGEYLSQLDQVKNLTDKGIIGEDKLDEVEKSIQDTITLFGENQNDKK